MNRKAHIATILAAAGGVAGLASGQITSGPLLLNGSGATLQENLFSAFAITNDFIDVNGDGVAQGIDPLFVAQNLVEAGVFTTSYRVTGSGNGILELDTFGDVKGLGGRAFDTGADNTDEFGAGTAAPETVPGNSAFADAARWNVTGELVIGGVLQVTDGDGNPVPLGVRGDFANPNHRGGLPTLATPTSFQETTRAIDATAGLHIDFSASDVPLGLFAIVDGKPDWCAAPGSAGYGGNPVLATDKAGVIATDDEGGTQSNLLRPLGVLNSSTASPNEQTVFSTPIAAVAVGALVNPGLGISDVFVSDLRHLNVTGRFLCGLNAVCVTRDSGSGTRNAFMNGIGIDPSWGRGENEGIRTTSSDNDVLGPNFQPSNKGGSSRMEGTVQNHRLATGHTGAERALADVIDDDYRFFGVHFDIKGATKPSSPTSDADYDYARPSIEEVIDGSADGFSIVGLADLSHVGNPRNAPPELGGIGYLEPFADQAPFNGRFDDGEPFVDINGSGVRDQVDFIDSNGNGMKDPSESFTPLPSPTDPTIPANDAVSGFINNIFRSAQSVETVPDDEVNILTPGEELAFRFLSTAALNNIPDESLSPKQPIALVPNPGLNATVRAATLDNNALNSDLARFFDPDVDGNASTTSFGRVPARTPGVTYTDGNAGNFYVAQDGTQFSYGTLLTEAANGLAGDIDGDGVRSAADAGAAVEALADRASFRSGEPVALEIVFDLNGDGDFDAADVRYFCDGLVLADKGLDVKPVCGVDSDGDGAIDSFTQGDGVTDLTLDRVSGFVAADNADTVDGNFFGTVFSNPGAVYDAGDSRADVAGSGGTTPGSNPVGADGVLDTADIDYIQGNFGTWFDLTSAARCEGDEVVVIDLSCDLNCDLVIDEADVAAFLAIVESGVGDANLDGVVDAADESIVRGNLGLAEGAVWSQGDFDSDGDVDGEDLLFATGRCNSADTEADGDNDILDVLELLSAFDPEDPNCTGPEGVVPCNSADTEFDGDNDILDVLELLSAFDPEDPNC